MKEPAIRDNLFRPPVTQGQDPIYERAVAADPWRSGWKDTRRMWANCGRLVYASRRRPTRAFEAAAGRPTGAADRGA